MKNNLFLILCAFVLLTSCRKEQPKMPNGLTDCGCASEVSADFVIEEMTGASDTQPWNFYTITDTIWQGKNVRFRVLEKDAEVKWYLGTEEDFGDKVGRYFGPQYGGQSLPIICVVKKKPNLVCFPNDDGYDSIVKYIHVSNHNVKDSSYLMEGVFRFKEKNSVDSVDLIINFRHNLINSRIIDIFNYDGQGNNYLNQSEIIGQNYREIRWDLNAHRAKFIHPLSGKVYLEIVGKSQSSPSFYYTGRKL